MKEQVSPLSGTLCKMYILQATLAPPVRCGSVGGKHLQVRE